MGSSRPWRPASQRDTIETVVQSEVLPELFQQLARKRQARDAAQREAEHKAGAMRRLRAIFNLPDRLDDLPSHWQR